MSNRKAHNLRTKRKYLVWLKDAKGFSEASIDKAAAAKTTYEGFLAGKDFRAFHAERARAFKRHLAGQKSARTGAPLLESTIGGTLREVRTFFLWLADQPALGQRVQRGTHLQGGVQKCRPYPAITKKLKAIADLYLR